MDSINKWGLAAAIAALLFLLAVIWQAYSLHWGNSIQWQELCAGTGGHTITLLGIVSGCHS